MEIPERERDRYMVLLKLATILLPMNISIGRRPNLLSLESKPNNTVKPQACNHIQFSKTLTMRILEP